MVINVFSSKDPEETHSMYCDSDNIDVLMGDKTDKIIVDVFDSSLQGYWWYHLLEESVRGGEFAFESLD